MFSRFYAVIILLVILLIPLAVSVSASEPLQSVPYSIGSWKESGYGNHRALVHVSSTADAVKVRIPWRRRDYQPEKKDIRIYDANTHKQITNVIRININREYGDLVFQPQTTPGNYEVYYLPYTPGVSYSDSPGEYFTPKDTADTDWKNRNSLNSSQLKSDKWKNLPAAEVTGIQARTEFDRFDPMEIIATADETSALINAHHNESYLLFPEDRKFPSKMTDDLPVKWVTQGPGKTFKGSAQPGEFYVFQVGVHTARQRITSLDLVFSDLKGKSGVISSKSIRCFNMGGVDRKGQPFKKVFSVEKHKVRSLWIGVQVPKEAEGAYIGTVKIAPKGAKASIVSVTLSVSGNVVKDGGVDDLWRLSRLNWLDSTIGIDDTVIPPYTPLKVSGNLTECLNRSVRFGNMGLPDSIKSNHNEILAAPIQLVITSKGKSINWQSSQSKVSKSTPATVIRQSLAEGGALQMATTSTMGFDGIITYDVTLKPKSMMSLNDLHLQVPIKREWATYMMGMGKRGGYRPKEWNWKWSIDHADNSIWIGDGDAGLQLKLLLDNDAYVQSNLKDTGIPDSWGNSGKGGARIFESGDKVVLDVFTGNRNLRAGQELHFGFRLIVTPFKPVDNRHWNWRIAYANSDDIWVPKGSNIWQVWHGQPEYEYINYPFLHLDRLIPRVKKQKALGQGVNLYNAIGMVSSRMVELWPLRSLGNEIFSSGEIMVFDYKGAHMNTAGGGYPWLMEHLGRGYVPGWWQPLDSGGSDAAIAVTPNSGLLNYYIESINWWMKNVGCDGLYLDGTSYDNDILKRVAKVMYRNNPDYRINAHFSNDYDYLDNHVNPLGHYMGDLAFLSSMWVGELIDYSRSPDYWLVEVSGMPFGVPSEMLNWKDGGNQWRGMVYGMSSRSNPSVSAMYKFWDEWKIQDSEMLGYWSRKCPVKTDNPDVLATVYKKKDEVLIALADWSKCIWDNEKGNTLRGNAITRIASKAPIIDGKISPGEWDNAAKLAGLVLTGTDEPASQQTECGITADSQNLYIAFRCNYSGGILKADVRGRDVHVWEDDAVELFIQPDTAVKSYYQFSGNSVGTIYDGFGSSTIATGSTPEWNGDWTYKTSTGQGYWEGELSIPIKSIKMNIPTDGSSIGFNICRDQTSGKSESSTWSRLATWYHEPDNFGRIKFSTTIQPTIQDAAAVQTDKKVRLKVDWKSLGLDPGKVTLVAPAIDNFQPAAEFSAFDSIPVKTSKGWLLIAKERK